MARLKFRTSIASISSKKTNEALIDSGATHNFFHSKDFFQTYKPFDETVASASGTSRIVGVGQVFIPLDGGLFMDAYHVPDFAENILSVHDLSMSFDVLFHTDENTNICACHMLGISTQKTVFKTDNQAGLYMMSIPNTKKEVSHSASV